MKLQGKDLRFLTTTALFTAILCITAPFTINIGPIPISLATFSVYLASIVLGWKGGTLAVVAYLVLGAVGLPVFSNFMGGFERLIGPTGGYLIGYIPCAFTIGLISDAAKKYRHVFNILSMVLGTALLYALGTIWYMFISGNPLGYSLSVCVVPFLAGDFIKMACATAAAEIIRGRVFTAFRKNV